MKKLILLLFLILIPTTGHSQVVPVSKFKKWPFGDSWGSYAIRPNKGDYPSCTPSISNEQLGTSLAIYLTGEFYASPLDGKGSWVSVGSNPNEVVYAWERSAAAPPACPGGVTPCFNYDDSWGTRTTCYYSAKAAGIRGKKHSDNLKSEAQEINTQAAAYRSGGQLPFIVIPTRWDLITYVEAQMNGFQLSFLQATNPANFDAFQTWLTNDTSTVCTSAPGGHCVWNDSYLGDVSSWRDHDLGIRFKDMINTIAGNSNAYKGYAYYMTRPPTYTLYPDAAMANQENDNYVRWKIQHVKNLISDIGVSNTIVDLNAKLNQRFPGPNGTISSYNWYILTRCPTMQDFILDNTEQANNCTKPWASPGAVFAEGGYTGDLAAAGQTYEHYILGLKNVADELTKAGLKYAWSTSGKEFSPSSPDFWDWGASSTNENTVLQQIALGASFLWITPESDDGRAVLLSQINGKIPYFISTLRPKF